MRNIMPKIFFVSLLAIGMTNVALADGPGKIGYDITLQLANIGIVISLIVIGFATILHRETLSMQHHLVRLILVAVFINFSWLVAVDGIIAISNSVGNTFLGGIFSESSINAFTGGFTSGLLGALHFRDFSSVSTGIISSLVTTLLSPFVMAIFMLLL